MRYKVLTAVILCCGMSSQIQAGLFRWKSDCGERCCKPQVARPCTPNRMSYQRDCAPNTCCPPGCAVPTCCAPQECGDCVPGEICSTTGCAPSCSAPGQCCNNNCTTAGCCSQQMCCEISALINESMTACYPRQRRNAVHHLSDYYDSACHPQIMTALIYALNDCDEIVRAKAADEIGDQIRRGYCCNDERMVCVLKFSLGDCDKRVRRQAEEALQLCGYQIVNGRYCCPPASQAGCRPAEIPPASDDVDATEAADPPEGAGTLEQTPPIDVFAPTDPAAANTSGAAGNAANPADDTPAAVTPPPMEIPDVDSVEPLQQPEAAPQDNVQPLPGVQPNADSEPPVTEYFPSRLHDQYTTQPQRPTRKSSFASFFGLGK